MPTFPEALQEYKGQLQKGAIQVAYRGLMKYMQELRTHFQNNYPDAFVSGSLYTGFMDMTYFSFIPEPFKQRKLKIAVVFLHEAFRFEVWLAGANKQVQAQYWKMFKTSGWNSYRPVPRPEGADSILEHVLAANPDFCDLSALTQQIESETLKFTRAIEGYLLAH